MQSQLLTSVHEKIQKKTQIFEAGYSTEKTTAATFYKLLVSIFVCIFLNTKL